MGTQPLGTDLAPAPGRRGHPGRDAVRVRALQRRFGARVVLKGVDLAICSGEFVALLGHSGTGKSTLLRALAGLDRDVEGHIEVPRARSVVFQDPRLLPWARVIDNVTLGLRGPGLTERGRTALEEVGLQSHASDWPKTLSGGEAQRAALARALVREPELLLLDEPFGALDALTRIKMHGLLRQLCARHQPAVLLVTHDVDEAIVLSDRVLVLSDGTVSFEVEVGTTGSRERSDPAFASLRGRLLRELGVVEDPEPYPVRPDMHHGAGLPS